METKSKSKDTFSRFNIIRSMIFNGFHPCVVLRRTGAANVTWGVALAGSDQSAGTTNVSSVLEEVGRTGILVVSVAVIGDVMFSRSLTRSITLISTLLISQL